MDSWNSLRRFTNARIALGRTGSSIPLKESLDFKLAHAHARDAVFSILDVEKIASELSAMKMQSVLVQSKAVNREQYLKRPDLGRQVNQNSLDALGQAVPGADISIVIADGLSAQALNNNVGGLLEVLIPALTRASFTIAPICIATQARVALGDEIGELLKCRLVIVLIGERPGLSSVNSIGVYLTYAPRHGTTDESRNCISNIHPSGLCFEMATEKVMYLVREAMRLKISGIKLKDESSQRIISHNR